MTGSEVSELVEIPTLCARCVMATLGNIDYVPAYKNGKRCSRCGRRVNRGL